MRPEASKRGASQARMMSGSAASGSVLVFTNVVSRGRRAPSSRPGGRAGRAAGGAHECTLGDHGAGRRGHAVVSGFVSTSAAMTRSTCPSMRASVSSSRSWAQVRLKASRWSPSWPCRSVHSSRSGHVSSVSSTPSMRCPVSGVPARTAGAALVRPEFGAHGAVRGSAGEHRGDGLVHDLGEDLEDFGEGGLREGRLVRLGDQAGGELVDGLLAFGGGLSVGGEGGRVRVALGVGGRRCGTRRDFLEHEDPFAAAHGGGLAVGPGVAVCS
jgi:hypothetical protein